MDTPPDIATDPAFDEIDFAQPVQENTAKPTPIQERADDWQAKTDALVEESLLALPELIAGVKLHPFTTARGSLLRRCGNEFVQGVALASIADPFLSVGKFLAVMSRPLPEARKLVMDDEELELASYEILDGVKMTDMGGVVAQVNEFVRRAMSNQVHGTPMETEGGSAEPPSPKN